MNDIENVSRQRSSNMHSCHRVRIYRKLCIETEYNLSVGNGGKVLKLNECSMLKTIKFQFMREIKVNIYCCQ